MPSSRRQFAAPDKLIRHGVPWTAGLDKAQVPDDQAALRPNPPTQSQQHVGYTVSAVPPEFSPAGPGLERQQKAARQRGGSTFDCPDSGSYIFI